MKVRQVLAVGVLAGVFAGCVCPCGSSWFGDDEEGFVQLFNGKDLDGWSDMKHVYHVENGELVFTGGPDVFGNIFYHRPFTNFIARFEFKLKYHGNNGFGVRAGKECFDGGALVGGYKAERDAAYNGMEIQILDNVCGRDRSLKSWQFHGSIYGVVAAQHGAEKPLGEWNSEEVRVIGDNVTVILNGRTILCCSIEDIEKTPDGLEHPGLHNKSGYIGFLGHTEPTRLRNIRIKEIL